MATSIGGRNVATTGSSHLAPGPAPAMSLAPPTPPAGPIPSPFVYISRSSSATGTQDKLKVGGSPVLVVESSMTVEQPGNIICNPTGGDVVTHMVDKKTGVYEGAGNVLAGGKKVSRTLDGCYMNIPTAQSKVAQLQTKLLESAYLLALGAAASREAGQYVGLLDPISAASGAVLDEDLDIEVRGLVPFELRRRYSSGRRGERGALGWGWAHCLEQWVDDEGDRATVRTNLGSDVTVALDADGRGFHRGQRIELWREGRRFTMRSIENRHVTVFEPLSPTDARAVVRSIKDPRGMGIELDYLTPEAGGRLAVARGPSGRELRFSYDARGLLVLAAMWSQNAVQVEVRYRYDDDDGLATVTDALGYASHYRYDGHHRLVEKTLPTGFSVGFAYDDETGRCVRTWGDNGVLSGRFEYDLKKGATAMLGNPLARIFHWDARGNVTAQMSSDGAVERHMRYDDDDYLVEHQDGAGNVWRFERDARGQLTRYVDAEGRTTTLAYDHGLLISQTDPGGFTSRYEYDAHDAMTRVRYPSGAELTMDYDARGRVTGVFGPNGRRMAFEYDAQDNCIADVGPLGERTEYAFDAVGRLTTRVDALGRSFEASYDARDRTVSRRFPDGTVTRCEYDALDRVVREVGPTGAVDSARYGATHALLEHTMPDGTTWRFGYDALERLCQVTSPLTETWEYGYDRAGRIAEERTFDGRVLRYQYDKGEFGARFENSDGSYRAYLNDATGRVLTEESPDGDACFERDELGRVVRAIFEEPLGTTEVAFEYDARGRQVAEIQDGQAVRYEWDPGGRMAARVLPDGTATRYGYDAIGQLIRVEHHGAVVTIARDPHGIEIGRHFHTPNVEVTSERDAMDRLLTQRVAPRTPDAKSLIERRYRYDARGWLTAVDDSRRGQRTFQHDDCARLVRANGQGSDEAFRYDASGYLSGVTRGAEVEQWALGPGNVLVMTPHAELEYDDCSRRTVRNDDRGRCEYFWDARSRLREVRFADGTRVIYVYDAYGRRVRKEFYASVDITKLDLAGESDPQKPIRTVRYLWEGRVLAAEIDSRGGTRVFVHEPGTFSPVLHTDGGRPAYYVHDHLRATSDLVDDKGALAWAPQRSVWGVVEGSTDTTASSPFRLLGHYHDEETGLSYAKNRYLEAETGRWISPDPLGLGGGRNPCGYDGSPVLHVNPLGLRSIIGNPAYDGYLRYAFRAAPLPGYYDVIVHGSPTSVAWKDANGSFAGNSLTPAQLAARIRAQPDYHEGDPVRLNACNVGKLPNGFAQQLANELNAPVLAPNRTIWAYGNGNLVVEDRAGSQDPVTGIVNPADNPGSFVPFRPPTAAATPTPTAAPSPGAPAGSS